MTIIIWISIGCFLLCPYYMCIFGVGKKNTSKHILYWSIFHIFFAGAGYFMCSEWFNIATLILICCVLYYFFSYIFYVRDLEKTLKQENIEKILKNKRFPMVSRCILIILMLFVVFDSVLIILSDMLLFEKIYLIVTVVFSFLQCIFYLKKNTKMSLCP